MTKFTLIYLGIDFSISLSLYIYIYIYMDPQICINKIICGVTSTFGQMPGGNT